MGELHNLKARKKKKERNDVILFMFLGLVIMLVPALAIPAIAARFVAINEGEYE
jgi:hypothetical protein